MSQTLEIKCLYSIFLKPNKNLAYKRRGIKKE